MPSFICLPPRVPPRTPPRARCAPIRRAPPPRADRARRLKSAPARAARAAPLPKTAELRHQTCGIFRHASVIRPHVGAQRQLVVAIGEPPLGAVHGEFLAIG